MNILSRTKYLKEFLLSAVMLTLVLGPFQPLIAQAQVGDGGVPTQQLEQQSQAVTGQTQTTLNSGGTIAPTTAPQNPATVTPTNTNPLSGAPSCGFSPSTWDLCITNVVYVFTVGIGSGFAYVAAYFFDLAVNLSLNGPAYALTFISTGWTTARDLANMAFLFILIYIAFTIMLEAETSGTMSLLAGVILIALLVNFSFFFTRVVIDAGNILSIQFYNSITAPSVQASAQTSNVAAGVTAATGVGANTKDLTASIMGMLQLQNLFSSNSFKTFYGNNTGTAGFLVVVVTLSFLYVAAGIMFYLITVMFVTIGVKFLVRIVVLWFLIIASPLAFVARAMPKGNKLRGYFDQWRDLLISHAFYPVAFMFIFLILTNFTNQMGNCSSTGGTSSQTCLINDIFTSLPPAGSTGSPLVLIGLAIANVAIRMGFVIAILYIGMKAADSVSVMGAKAAAGAGSWAGGWYKASTSGLAARTGGSIFRETIGRQAANDINSMKKNPPRTAFGQYFDYAWRKNVLAPIAGTSLGGAKSYDDINKYRKERKDDMAVNKRGAENAEVIKTAGEKLAAGTPITNDEKNRIQRISKREFEGMKVSDIKAISTVLTEDQIKKVGDIEKIAEKEREEIKANWEEKSEEAPFNKSVKKLEEISRNSAAGLAEINTHRGSGKMVDGEWSGTLKRVLQQEHNQRTTEHTGAEHDLREARREHSASTTGVALKVAEAAHAAAPTAATTASVAATKAAHDAAPTAAVVRTAESQVHTTLAARQKSQSVLDAHKDFEDNRKKVDANENLNNNGVKGTYKASLI